MPLLNIPPRDLWPNADMFYKQIKEREREREKVKDTKDKEKRSKEPLLIGSDENSASSRQGVKLDSPNK